MRYGEEPADAAEKKGSTKMVLKPTTKATLELGSSGPGTAKQPVAWDSNGAKTLRSSFANLRNPSQAPHGAPTGPRATGRPKSTLNMMMNVQTPSAVAANLATMNINGPQNQNWNPNNEKYYDPSAGPNRINSDHPVARQQRC
jgi:hypothetical protein